MQPNIAMYRGVKRVTPRSRRLAIAPVRCQRRLPGNVTLTQDALVNYPFENIVGDRFATAMFQGRFCRGSYNRSACCLRVLGTGELHVVQLDFNRIYAESLLLRSIYFIGCADQITEKLVAFRHHLDRLLIDDRSGFAQAFGQGDQRVYHGRQAFGRDFWTATGEGLIWTFSQDTALKLRDQHRGLCKQFYPELYNEAPWCPNCNSILHPSARTARFM